MKRVKKLSMTYGEFCGFKEKKMQYKFQHMVTQNMIDDIEMGRPISRAAIADYGLENPVHRSAFLEVVSQYKDYKPFVEELDKSLGSGEKITALVGRFSTRPLGLIFRTVWDDIAEEEEFENEK